MDELRELLKKTIREIFDVEVEPEITPAPLNVDADYSSNVALKLAKDLHDNPFSIAEKLS